MEEKNSQSDDILPRYRTQQWTRPEKESQDIIKSELGRYFVPSINENRPGVVCRKGCRVYTGFLEYYLIKTKNDKTLTTTAKFDVVQALSKNDLLWDSKLHLQYFCNLF